MKTIHIIKHNLFKRSVYLLFISVALLGTGCNDMLDEKLYDAFDEQDFFSNTTRLEMGVNAAYTTLNSQDNYGQSWMVYDADTDMSHVKGAGIGHVARDLAHYNVYTSHPWLESSWALYYQGINRMNTILARKDEVEIKSQGDTLKFNNLVAQTKALRALAYFDLVRLFGDVPLKLTPSRYSDNFKIPRSIKSDIYDQIIKDLNEAIPDLYLSDNANQNGERISKTAAMGILARVYLFRGGYSLEGSGAKGVLTRPSNYREYYENANKVIDEVIKTGKHGLNNSYERVFRNMCELVYDPYENMLEIAFFTLTGQKGGASTQGTYNGPEINQQSKFGRANSFIKTHHFFYDLYDDDDQRKDVSVAKYSIDAKNVYKKIAQNQSYNWSPGKWRRDWQTGKVKDNNNTDVNVVLLRYSDILLMKAEVENELNGAPNDAALEALNKVRRRAFGKPYLVANDEVDFKLSDLPTKQAFFDEIVNERARELAFEGHRRQDLIRWGLLEKAIMDTKQKFADAIARKELNDYTFEAGLRFKAGVNELYPIPQYEIRETGNIITQNPGY